MAQRVPPYQPLPSNKVLELINATINSHSQETDGFIIGASLAGTSIRTTLPMMLLSNPLLISLNGPCLPASGVTGGVEIVYDFKHQERGIFWYTGNVLNIGTDTGAGAVSYLGLTRGFANQQSPLDPGGYINGVKAYGGYFGSVDLSFSKGFRIKGYGISGGITGITAAPLQDDRTLNPNGVFATYFGLSGSVGKSYLPVVSGDIATTNYHLLNESWPGRIRYALPFSTSGLTIEEITERQTSTARRIVAATTMANEIRMLSGGLAGNPITSFAIAKLYDFALRP